MYNKTVINWLLGQQQFCLTLEQICCPKLAALDNRSILRSNKLLLSSKSIQLLYIVTVKAVLLFDRYLDLHHAGRLTNLTCFWPALVSSAVCTNQWRVGYRAVCCLINPGIASSWLIYLNLLETVKENKYHVDIIYTDTHVFK